MHDETMPQGAPEISWDECIKLLNDLPALPVESRKGVIKRLLRTTSPGIRDRALQMGAALFSDDQITALLRDGADDVMRNAGLEMLKKRGSKGYDLGAELLNDNDPDVVLQAILVLDHLRDPRAFDGLRLLLGSSDTNLIQAAIVAIGHLGDSRAISDLLPFLKREVWLQLAAVNALGDIRSSRAVPVLKKMLNHEDIAFFVLEALARIGGGTVFPVLAEYWMKKEGHPDSGKVLGLLAHVAEGVQKKPPVTAALKGALAKTLEHAAGDARLCAARCLLVSGPGEHDINALRVLKETLTDETDLPACLKRRKDLVKELLNHQEALLRRWGLMLCASGLKRDIPVESLVAVIMRLVDYARSGDHPDNETMAQLVTILGKIKDERVAKPLLTLYTALLPNERSVLAAEIRKYRARIPALMNDGADSVTLLVLQSIIGGSAEKTAAAIMAMKDDERLSAIRQLSGSRRVLRLLPWTGWLETSRETYINAAAAVAVSAKLPGLMKLLRNILKEEPNIEIVKAMGEARDRKSVPFLIAHLSDATPIVRAFLMESLGKIGGDSARDILKKLAMSEEAKDSRLAYKALAMCATEEDGGFFRNAVTNHDWFIRLACVDILGRFRTPENLAVLAQLASDPVNVVAQRALTSLHTEAEQP